MGFGTYSSVSTSLCSKKLRPSGRLKIGGPLRCVCMVEAFLLPNAPRVDRGARAHRATLGNSNAGWAAILARASPARASTCT